MSCEQDHWNYQLYRLCARIVDRILNLRVEVAIENQLIITQKQAAAVVEKLFVQIHLIILRSGNSINKTMMSKNLKIIISILLLLMTNGNLSY